MKYDYKDDTFNGFYTWNKQKFLINKSDERFDAYQKFKKENGFSPDECWNLDQSLCMFLIPRLKFFKENTLCFPTDLKTIDEWKNILDKMIWSFEEIICSMSRDTDLIDNNTEEYINKLHEGLDLFAKYFMDLWW